MRQVSLLIACMQCAATLLISAQLEAQASPERLSPEERARAVGQMLAMRSGWLGDETKVDGCSVRRATEDARYRDHVDPTYLRLITDRSVADCDNPLAAIGVYVEVIEVGAVSNSKSTGSNVFVDIWVRNGRMGHVRQRYIVRGERGIHISPPYNTSDRGDY